MRNWKTNAFALATLAAYVVGYFYPQHKEFTNGLVTALLASGLIAAKDYNVTGGK